MRELIIVGNGSYSQMLRNYIELTEFSRVVAYAVDKECIQEKELNGIPVISFEDLREKYSCEDVSLIMGIGYTQMGDIRKRVFEKCKLWGYKFENYIHPTAIIAEDVVMGEGNNILEGVIIEVGVSIGNANLFFGGTMIAHESTIGSYNTFSVKVVVAGCVTVQNNCFLGASSAVKDHITLKDYVLLGAMAFGFKNMESYSVITPAKSVILEDRKSTDFL